MKSIRNLFSGPSPETSPSPATNAKKHNNHANNHKKEVKFADGSNEKEQVTIATPTTTSSTSVTIIPDEESAETMAQFTTNDNNNNNTTNSLDNSNTPSLSEEGPPPPPPTRTFGAYNNTSNNKVKFLPRRSNTIRSDASNHQTINITGVGTATTTPTTPLTSAELDATAHRIRGGGILASSKDINIPPAEFAEGCKLLQAAARGDVNQVDRLLKRNPTHVNFRDYDRRTALHVASSEGHLHVVTFLVERGANINRSDRWGGSPLDDAHRHRHADVIQYLRGLGATTGSADQTSNLITAAAEGDLDEVKMLLAVASVPAVRTAANAGAASNSERDTSSSSLTLSPVDINKGDYDKRTALHLAAGEGHADVVEFLCLKGANVNIEDRWGGRPLDDAMRRNFQDCVSILQRYGAQPGKQQEANSSSKATTADGGEDGDKTNIGTSGSDLTDENMRVDFEELEMIERIGAGAFGEIYKCRWRGILVAAKCIKSAKIRKEWLAKQPGRHADDSDEAEMTQSDKDMALADFRKETSILRNLRHPNICMLLAYSTTENFEVMISELMKCSLLDIFKANMLHNTPMSKRTQIVYAQQLAQGMNYLHTCKPPIIHRDLKPANLLVDFSGTLKITDFGLAKIRPDPETKDKDQFLMTGETGSYRFMAPEVFRHEEYSETVDIYSYAMILYYLLAGKPPWAACNGLKAVAKAAIDGDRPFIPREWDKRLSDLLQRCWAENPHARPPFSTILTVLNEYSRDVFKTKADTVAMTEPDKGCNCVIS